MSQGIWAKKHACRVVAFLDFVIAVLLVLTYTCSFIFENRRRVDLVSGYVDFEQSIGLYIITWILIYIVNLIQGFVAVKLLTSLKPDYPDTTEVQSKASIWLWLSSGLFLLLLVKLVLFITFWVKNSTVDVLVLVMCLIEIIFRVLTTSHVKKLADDLKYPSQRPSIKLITLFKSGTVTVEEGL